MKMLLLGSLIGGLLVFGFTIFGLNRKEINQKEPVVNSSVNDDLAKKVDRLESNISSLKLGLSQVNRVERPVDQASELDENNEELNEEKADKRLSFEERQQLEKERILGRCQALDEILEKEEYDPDWTSDTTASLNSILSDRQIAGTEFEKIDCSSSLCRISVSHDGFEAFQNFRDRGLDGPPFNGAFFFRYDEETLKTVIYLTKPGETLPRYKPS